MSQSVHHLAQAQNWAIWIAMGVSIFVAIGMSFWASLHARPRDDDDVQPNTPIKRQLLPKTFDGKFR
jgi:hypothetical protein